MNKKLSVGTVMQISIVALLVAVMYLFYIKSPIPDASASTTLSKEEIQAIIKEYINDNPEVIIASLQQMQDRQKKEEEEAAKKTLGQKRSEIEDLTISPVIGNPKGDVIIVEFFDYRCGYCKRLLPTLSKLLKEDNNIAIVLKEFPILGAASQKAAEVALAVYAIDKEKYYKLHDTLMASNDLNNEEAIIAKAVALGVDRTLLEKQMKNPDIQLEITRNHDLASELGVRGTPAFIIDGELIPGAVDINTFREKIKKARAKKAE